MCHLEKNNGGEWVHVQEARITSIGTSQIFIPAAPFNFEPYAAVAKSFSYPQSSPIHSLIHHTGYSEQRVTIEFCPAFISPFQDTAQRDASFALRHYNGNHQDYLVIDNPEEQSVIGLQMIANLLYLGIYQDPTRREEIREFRKHVSLPQPEDGKAVFTMWSQKGALEAAHVRHGNPHRTFVEAERQACRYHMEHFPDGEPAIEAPPTGLIAFARRWIPGIGPK